MCVCAVGGSSQASVLEPRSLPRQVAVVFLDLADTGHQLGETSALTLPSTLENIPPTPKGLVQAGLGHLEKGLDKCLGDKPLTRKSWAADPQKPVRESPAPEST